LALCAKKNDINKDKTFCFT